MASVLAMPEDLDDPIYNPEDNKSFGFSDYNMSPYKSCKSLSSAKMPPKSPKCMSSKGWSLCTQQQKNIDWENGILLPKLSWPTVRKNCSGDREKLLKFEAEGREFAKFLRSL